MGWDEVQQVLAELPEIRTKAILYQGRTSFIVAEQDLNKLCSALQAAADKIENISKENARLRESLVKCTDAHEYYKENQRLQAEVLELRKWNSRLVLANELAVKEIERIKGGSQND